MTGSAGWARSSCRCSERSARSSSGRARAGRFCGRNDGASGGSGVDGCAVRTSSTRWSIAERHCCKIVSMTTSGGMRSNDSLGGRNRGEVARDPGATPHRGLCLGAEDEVLRRAWPRAQLASLRTSAVASGAFGALVAKCYEERFIGRALGYARAGCGKIRACPHARVPYALLSVGSRRTKVRAMRHALLQLREDISMDSVIARPTAHRRQHVLVAAVISLLVACDAAHVDGVSVGTGSYTANSINGSSLPYRVQNSTRSISIASVTAQMYANGRYEIA